MRVAVDVGDEAVVLTDPPSGVVPEVVADLKRRRVTAVAGGDRGVHPGLTEPDHVGPPVAGDVDDEPRMPVTLPALVGAEIPHDELLRVRGGHPDDGGRDDRRDRDHRHP